MVTQEHYNMERYTVPSENELNQLLKETFTSAFRSEYVNVKGFTLPKRYYEFEQRINEFEVCNSDVWICGFPKTGTTWMSEIAWLISHDLDYEGAKELDYVRTRIIDFSFLFEDKKESPFDKEDYATDSISYCSQTLKPPRQIKSHLPFFLLPKQIVDGTKQPKIIYTIRNPMDTCVSYFHNCVNVEGFTGNIHDFCKLFLFDKINYGPFSNHALSFWEVRDRPNILLVKYEDMKKDLRGSIKKVAEFLEKTLTEEEIVQLEEHVSFNSMKNNAAVNKQDVFKSLMDKGIAIKTPFIREGKVGGYKSSMPEDLIPQFHYWMKKRFEGTGLDIINV